MYRRWPPWRNYLPSVLDDVLIGLFLLYGAWFSSRDTRRGRAVLAAAWGFTAGLGYASLFGHLRSLDAPDPSGFPHAWIAAVIGAGWILSLVALTITLSASEEQKI